MKTVVATAGMPGSGKGMITKYLKAKGFEVVVMSDAVKEKMAEKRIEVNNRTLREFGIDLRNRFGRNIVSQLCIKKIKAMESDRIVLDGVRSPEEVDFMREQKGINFILVAVEAEKETRFRRITERGREDDMKTRAEFEFREEKEIEYGQENVIGMADIRIDNNKTIIELDKQVDELLGEF